MMKDFEAGTYYVGDLSYIMSDVWAEICIHFGEDVFTLEDGRKCAMFSTMYGNGTYLDQYGVSYDVGSGTIGCVRAEYLEVGMRGNPNAMVMSFFKDFDVYSESGVIHIGHIQIDTDD